jgi:hypothetical protein
MSVDDNVLTFTAIQGIQAGRQYYSVTKKKFLQSYELNAL